MLKFSDSRNFTRTLAAICLIATPLILLVGTIVGPDTSDDAAKALTQIEDNKAGYVIGGLLFLIGPLVFVPGMMGTIRLMRRRGVTLGQIGAALIMFGALVTMAFYGFGLVEYYAATEKGLDHAQMAKLIDAADDSALLIPVLVGFLGGLLLGSILLGVALWRSRVVPVWSPIALVVSAIFGQSQSLSIVGFALLLVALVPIAQKILSISDDEWERWQLPEAGEAPAPPPQPGGPS